MLKQNCYSLLQEDLKEVIEFIEGAYLEYFDSRRYFDFTLQSVIGQAFGEKAKSYYEEFKPRKTKKITDKDIKKIEEQADDILNLFRKEE